MQRRSGPIGATALAALGLAAVLVWCHPGDPTARPARMADPPARQPTTRRDAAPVVPPTDGREWIEVQVPPPYRPRTRDPRGTLTRDLPADTRVGAAVQGAMDGEAHPWLLDTLARLPIQPGDLASAAASVDPWLAVGLVDLERRMATRCKERELAHLGRLVEPAVYQRAAGTAAACWEPVLELEEGLAEELPESVRPAVELFASRDRVQHAVLTPDEDVCGINAELAELAVEGDGLLAERALGLVSVDPCPENLDLLHRAVVRQVDRGHVAGDEGWMRVLWYAIEAGDGPLVERSLANIDPSRPELPRLRASAIAAGLLEPADWRDALRARAIGYHGRDDGDARLVGDGSDGGWRFQADDPGDEDFAACVGRLSVQVPQPVSVGLLVRAADH